MSLLVGPNFLENAELRDMFSSLSFPLQDLWASADDSDATWMDDPRFRALLLQAKHLVKNMSNRTCGNCVWALAKLNLNVTDPTVCAILVRASCRLRQGDAHFPPEVRCRLRSRCDTSCSVPCSPCLCSVRRPLLLFRWFAGGG